MHERRFSAEIERLRSPERLERLELNRVLDLCLEGKRVSSVLDIGTGSGVFAEGFVNRGLAVTGIDPNPEMLVVSKKHVPGAEFHQATAESMPFDDKSFDLVFMGLVLHETDDLEKALSECKRCARESVVALEWPYKQEESGPPLEHRLKSEDVESIAKKAGFESVSVIALKQLLLYRFQI